MKKKQESSDWTNAPQKTTKDYLKICNQIQNNNDLFSKFRSNQEYGQILSGSDKSVGDTSLNRLRHILSDTNILSQLSSLKLVDSIGSPHKFSYGKFGNIDPSTLKYLFIKSMIIRSFNLNSVGHLKIVEIGGGYGGQAASFTLTENVKSYTIIDLPEAVGVAQKFLSELGLIDMSKLSFLQSGKEDLVDGKDTFDLGIADSSLAELSAKLQSYYLEKVLSKCEYIFIHWNTCHFRRGILQKKKFIEKLRKKYKVVEQVSDVHGQYVFATKNRSQKIPYYKFVQISSVVKIVLQRFRYFLMRPDGNNL